MVLDSPPPCPQTIPPPQDSHTYTPPERQKPPERSAAAPVSSTNGYPKDGRKSKSTPWYRTTKGLAIAIVVTLVLVGVILVGVIATQAAPKKRPSQPTPTQGDIREEQTSPSVNVTTSGVSAISSGTYGGGTQTRTPS